MTAPPTGPVWIGPGGSIPSPTTFTPAPGIKSVNTPGPAIGAAGTITGPGGATGATIGAPPVILRPSQPCLVPSAHCSPPHAPPIVGKPSTPPRIGLPLIELPIRSCTVIPTNDTMSNVTRKPVFGCVRITNGLNMKHKRIMKLLMHPAYKR